MNNQNNSSSNIIFGLITKFDDKQLTRKDYLLELTLDNGQIIRFTYDFIARYYSGLGQIQLHDEVLILKPNNKNNAADEVRITVWRNDVHIRTFKLSPQKLEIIKK